MLFLETASTSFMTKRMASLMALAEAILPLFVAIKIRTITKATASIKITTLLRKNIAIKASLIKSYATAKEKFAIKIALAQKSKW
ncbi:hypothetical protein D3C87_1927940 [compost metagenome]